MSRDRDSAPIRSRALASILARLGASEAADPDPVPTGSPALDRAIGIGGYPRGRVIEIYGPASSGKTTLALHAIAEVQQRGGTAAFVDAEHALDVGYAERLGVDPGRLLVSRPDHAEQALQIAETLLRSGAVELVVVDSVAALVPQAELGGRTGEPRLGLQARLMAQALREIAACISRSRTIAMFVDQLREIDAGGNALKFHASLRLEIRRIGAVKRGEEVIGARTRIRVVKNRLAPPLRSVEVDLVYGRGIRRAGEPSGELSPVRRDGGTAVEPPVDREDLGCGRRCDAQPAPCPSPSAPWSPAPVTPEAGATPSSSPPAPSTTRRST